MIKPILTIMVFLTASIPALNKYFNAKIDIKFHIYLAYLTMALAVVSFFI